MKTHADPGRTNKISEDAEKTRTITQTLGDACDPVPCPKASAPAVGRGHPDGVCQIAPEFYRVIRDEIAITPVGPHVLNAVSTVPVAAVPLPDVPTKARFCQPSIVGEVDCYDNRVLRDDQLFEGELAEIRTEPNKLKPWNRVTVAETRTGVPNGRNENIGHLVTYADNGSRSIFWWYLTDNQRWHENGTDVVGSNRPAADCSKGGIYGAGTCLNGVFWLHAETRVGNDIDTVGTTLVGTHGQNLANYYFPIQPDEAVGVGACEIPELHPCLFSPMSCVADFLYRFSLDSCPMCDARVDLKRIADDRIQIPFVRDPSASLYGLLWKDALLPAAHFAVEFELATALFDSHFVTAVESAPPLAGEVDAVALAPAAGLDSQYLRVASYNSGLAYDVEQVPVPAGLGAGLMSGAVSATRTASSSGPAAMTTVLDRLGAKVVYSRTMGGAFVLGGADAFGMPSASVEFAQLYGGARMLAGYVSGDVLAATLTRPSSWYDYVSGQAEPSYLWTITRDHDVGDIVLSVREITRDDVGAPLVSLVLESTVDDDYALATAWDEPDRVLLTLSERTSGNWALYEVGGFLANGCYDSECVAIRPLLRRDALGGTGHLFRGIYAEQDAIVVPSTRFDDAHQKHQPRTDRLARPSLGTAAPVEPGQFRSPLN